MINAILGKKIEQAQKFLQNGTRVAVTKIMAGGNFVVENKGNKVKLGFDSKRKNTKPIQGILKKAGISKNLRFFREIAFGQTEDPSIDGLKPGTAVVVGDVFKLGDMVQVSGISKGKGFQGGVKLHHFKGGPRTHGQSDRERAPGSIGQTTTPGRVYKGKRMAARMGTNRVTIKNLEVLEINGDVLTIKGLVPGGRNGLLIITKTGEDKKFVPLYQEQVAQVEQVEKVEEAQNAG